MQIPDTMRAVVLRGVGFDNLAIETLPVPEPGPDQLLARVDAAGICTSLIKTIAHGGGHTYFYGQNLAKFPAILGDEGSVTIARVGTNLKDRFSVGERFVVQPAVDSPPINNLERYENSPQAVNKLGCGYTLPGHLSEFMLIPEEVLQADCMISLAKPYPPYAHAAIAEPFSCCVSGQSHHVRVVTSSLSKPRRAVSGLKSDGILLVVGLGAMGRMNIEVAIASGTKTIIGVEPLESRRTKTNTLFAERLKKFGGALRIETPDRASLAVKELTSGRGVDDLIVAVASQSAIEQSLPLLAKGGVANLFAGLRQNESKINFDGNAIHYDELVITGSSGGIAWDLQQTLDYMSAGKIKPAQHIKKIGSLDHAIDLIDDVRCQKLDGKAVLYPHIKLPKPLIVDGWTASDEASLLH